MYVPLYRWELEGSLWPTKQLFEPQKWWGHIRDGAVGAVNSVLNVHGDHEGRVEGRMAEIRRKIISDWPKTKFCNFSGRTAGAAQLWQHQKVRESLSSLGHPGTIAASAWILGFMSLGRYSGAALGTGFWRTDQMYLKYHVCLRLQHEKGKYPWGGFNLC